MDPLDILATYPQPFADYLGMEFTHADPERVVARMTVTEAHCTTGGIVHGGAVMALADNTGAAGTVLNLPKGAGTATIESKTNFVGPAPAGTVLIAEATAIHRGRRTQIWQTRIETDAGRLVAVVTQTQIVLEPRNTNGH